MEARLLTLNAGSSSLKFALFLWRQGEPAPQRILRETVSRLTPGGADPMALLDAVVAHLRPHGGVDCVSAVGHRFVHGGPFDGPRALTEEVRAALQRLAALDPDHLPAALALAEALRARRPDLRQVACFDTAFHRTMPRVARIVPIPRAFQARGVERYGFHGLSCAYLGEELARVAGREAARGRVVLAHLGSGSSLTALSEGVSVDTTMGFTPTSGIPMGTRSGDLDPGVIVHLLRSEGMTVEGLDELLNRRSGLLGVSGSSADVRDLLAAEQDDPRAADALELYCYRARQAVGALAATLGGLETLVFSGGIGENAPAIRARIAGPLGHLGVRFDDARNAAGASVISADASPCTVRVIATDEEAVIARQTMRLVGWSPSPGSP